MADGSVAEVEYRDIPGFPGYRAGSDGSIWSRRRVGRYHDATGWRKLNPSKNTGGYYVVILYAESRPVQLLVHRIVLETFVGPRPPGTLGAHNNGVRTDNRPENLSWKTSKENWDDQRLHGTAPEGEKSPLAKLRAADVLEIVRLRNEGVAYRMITARFGITASGVSNIMHGKCWRSLTGIPKHTTRARA